MVTIVHFDISADETQRAQRFYERLFGWTFNSLPAPTGYSMIATTDLNGAPGVADGMAKRTGQGSGIVNFMGVASVDSSSDQVEQRGDQLAATSRQAAGSTAYTSRA